MANTVSIDNKTLSIIPDGSTDFDYVDDGGMPAGSGFRVNSISFIPSTSDDRLIMRAIDDTGTVVVDLGLSGTEMLAKDYFGQELKLYMKNADCTFTLAANCRILINLA